MTRGVEEHRSVCRVCHGGCAARLYVENGRLVKARPDPSSTFSLGRMCVKGLATPEIMYHPDRLLSRSSARASGAPASGGRFLGAALGEIARRSGEMRAQSGPESIALGQGTGRHHYFQVIRFANTLGTPNWYEPGLANCFIPRITVSNLTYGGFVAADYHGPVKPRTIIFWGHNPLVTAPTANWAGPRPGRSGRGPSASPWTPAVRRRPGAAASGCPCGRAPTRPGPGHGPRHHLRGPIRPEFVRNTPRGSTSSRSGWPPARPMGRGDHRRPGAAHRRGRPALRPGQAGRAGVGRGHRAEPELPANRARPGGAARADGQPGPARQRHLRARTSAALPRAARGKLPEGALQKRIGAEAFKLLGGFRAYMPSAHIPGALPGHARRRPLPGAGASHLRQQPLTTVAGAGDVPRSLIALDLLVVSELFMTPSAALADYVLPAAFWPEVNQIVELPCGGATGVVAQQQGGAGGRVPPGRGDPDRPGARRICPARRSPWKSILDYRLEPLGVTFAELKERHHLCRRTSTGSTRKAASARPRARWSCTARGWSAWATTPCPRYRSRRRARSRPPDLAPEFPWCSPPGPAAGVLPQRAPPGADPAPAPARPPGRNAPGELRRGRDCGRRLGPGVSSARAHPHAGPGDRGHPRGRGQRGPRLVVPRAGPPRLRRLGVQRQPAHRHRPPYDPAFGSYQLRGLLCG